MHSAASSFFLYRFDPCFYRGGFKTRGGHALLERCLLVYHGQPDVCGGLCQDGSGQKDLPDDVQKTGISSVDVDEIIEVDRPAEKSYQPGHPKADKDGFIYTAAVNVDEELVEMLEASRQYENNVEMVTTLRGLMMRTINMGK